MIRHRNHSYCRSGASPDRIRRGGTRPSRSGPNLSRMTMNPGMATEPRTYPSELPVLALRQTVVFPLTLQPLAINRPLSIESVNRALAGDRLLLLTLQNTDERRSGPADLLRQIGTIAVIRQMAKVPNGGMHVIVEGIARARADVDDATGHVAARARSRRCRSRSSARSKSTRTCGGCRS